MFRGDKPRKDAYAARIDDEIMVTTSIPLTAILYDPQTPSLRPIVR